MGRVWRCAFRRIGLCLVAVLVSRLSGWVFVACRLKLRVRGTDGFGGY